MQELNSSTKNWNPPIPLEEEVHLYPWPDNVYPEPFNAFIPILHFLRYGEKQTHSTCFPHSPFPSHYFFLVPNQSCPEN